MLSQIDVVSCCQNCGADVPLDGNEVRVEYICCFCEEDDAIAELDFEALRAMAYAPCAS